MNHARQKTGDTLRLWILQGVEVILIMKIVQIVHRMEFESINTSKKHYITVHYKKIFRHGALSYRYERLLFFLILSKNKISYSRNNRKGSPYFWVFKTTSNPCSTNNGNSTCDSKRPKMAILVSSEDQPGLSWRTRVRWDRREVFQLFSLCFPRWNFVSARR